MDEDPTEMEEFCLLRLPTTTRQRPPPPLKTTTTRMSRQRVSSLAKLSGNAIISSMALEVDRHSQVALEQFHSRLSQHIGATTTCYNNRTQQQRNQEASEQVRWTKELSEGAKKRTRDDQVNSKTIWPLVCRHNNNHINHNNPNHPPKHQHHQNPIIANNQRPKQQQHLLSYNKTSTTRQTNVKRQASSFKCKHLLPVLLSCLVVLLSLIVIQMVATNGLSVYAYQLTNNLIANNLPPKFITSANGQASNSEIVVRVKEGSASIGKLIYTLKGEDPDEDPLTFGVLGSMASDLLRIENVPGNQANVYLRKELDRETTESYQVVITLTDGKLGRGNWITKSMLIIVEDVNDNYPVFGPHRTAISIREDVKVPLVIETIEATDQDEGRFGQVIYKLDELDDSLSGGFNSAGSSSSKTAVSNMFSIETIDGKGIISLISPLDYEQKALYQLRVLAVDRAIEHERLTATTSILISVEDCEDQPPMFTFVPSITRIPENLPIGSPIVRVAAIDGDRGINNQIQYKIVSVNGQENGFERNLFSINSDTGQISVAHELNRESNTDPWSPLSSIISSAGSSSKNRDQLAVSQPGSYVIQVRASELGSGGASKDNSVSTELTVILTDVNDETPTFNQITYYGEILENSTPENLVSFISGPSSANQQGGGAASQVQVVDNQHQPPVVISAKVVDRDQGTNGTFTLHLEGEHSQLFDIWPREATNEANFMIKISSHLLTSDSKTTGGAGLLSSALDYEKNKMFQFTIVAREKYTSNQQQLRSNSAQMTVFLKDANDNYPQFESELYRVEIPENAIRGMHICAVKATDADSGIYGSQGIRYTEIRGEKANKFKLDPLTGVITLKTNDHGFDRETIGQHHLIVEARDSNGAGNRNTTQLLIILTDTNDQRPKFLLDQYEAFIYENELDFQSPLQVQAIDNDAQNTTNSRITYSIVGGDPQQNFTIDPLSGRIRVRNTLVLSPTATTSKVSNHYHHHHHNQYQASSSGGDNNNNHHDGDSDILVLDSTTTATSGIIGQQPQVVVSSGGLDFEGIAQKRDDTRQFNLTVRATDSGLPEPLSDTTQVIILVYDKNDHAPVFTRNVYTKSIREDAKEGSQVLQVLAQDGDHSPTNSKITYRISSGASDKFVIDSDSGLISVANGANLDIDRVVGGQRRTNYLLNVIAFDGSFGPNQKSSSALVNITIIDVNNKSPEFITLGQVGSGSSSSGARSQQQVVASSAVTTIPSTSHHQQQQQLMVVYVNEDAPYGLIVTRVVAIDLDSSAELRYSINYARSEGRNEDMILVDPTVIKDLFSIEPTDGTIKVAKQLDREMFDQVKLRLQVEDIAAQTPDQIAYTYLLVKITDVNDNRPVFKKPVYKAVVNENSISGTSVITLTADDRDLNKTLKYSLDGTPEMMRLIRINPRSGEVTVNDKIDREMYPLINVTVQAEDYGHPHPLTGTTQLLITVRDENDNNPMFLNASQIHPYHHLQDNGGSFDLNNDNDNQPKNHNMNDSSSSSTYRHRSLAPHRFESTTTVHSVVIPSSSDNPLSNSFELPLDGSEATTSDSVGGSIFNKLPLLAPGSTARIREDAQIGFQVAYVRAEDADVGNNGRVTYLLDAISSGGKFRIDRDSGIISVASLLDRETSKHYSLIIEACDNYDLGYSTGESRRAFTQVNIQITDVNDNVPVIMTNLQSGSFSSSINGGADSLHLSSASSFGADRVGGVYPTYDDIMNSPGPYELPLADCLFISEFQPLNEPILTVTATDADDPNTPNGQVDLAIVNNLPQNDLFGLVAIPSPTSRVSRDTMDGGSLLPSAGSHLQGTDRSTTSGDISAPGYTDYMGFGDLTLGETSIASSASVLDQQQQQHDNKQQQRSRSTTDHDDNNNYDDNLQQHQEDETVAPPKLRPKRTVQVESSLMEPAAAVGNFYSPAARAQALGSFSVMGAHQTLSSLRQRQPSVLSPPSARSLIQTTTNSGESPAMNTRMTAPPTPPPPAVSATLASPVSRHHRNQGNGHHHHYHHQNLDGGEQQVHIVVTQSLKERVGNYSILVRATDRGQPSLSSVKLINICVQDVNNHSPVFTRPPLNHTIRIMENATIGTYVTQVEATDSDHGLNGELQYSLKPTNIQSNNNDWQSFKIDRLSGVITTAKQFNRQVRKYYTLRVQAQDFGRPTTLSSDTDINIMIVNSGQYQPEFDVQTQSLQFTENVAPGIEWFTLLPTTNLDDDPALINAPTNSQQQQQPSDQTSGQSSNPWLASPCYFIIDSDDQDQLFHLDRYTHRLTNKKVIDRERKANFTLLIQATNNCNKIPAAPIYARSVDTTSAGFTAPKATNTDQTTTTTSIGIEYRSSDGISSVQLQPAGGRAARLSRRSVGADNLSASQNLKRDKKSIERSISPHLSTKIGYNETTTLTNNRGQMSSAKLVASSQAEDVSGTGGGFNQAAVDALLTGDKTLLKVLIKIKDVNDNAPRFTQRVYTGGITTEADFGTIFMIVQAVDADADSQIVYSIVKPIKRNLLVSGGGSDRTGSGNNNRSGSDSTGSGRQKRAATQQLVTTTTSPTTTSLANTIKQTNNQLQAYDDTPNSPISSGNDILMNDGDDLFVINSQTGEISLNFDPQKHMKGYFEFEIMANDTDGLFDSAKVFIYLLRQDQRVKFVLRLTPQELRQRLNKFRSVFGNITGAIVNIDSYKYYENHDGSVDKKKTSLYLHFVNPEDNTIIDVDKVLTLIDNNIEYLDELYKEFHVLSSEAAHLPLSSSALIDPIDQIRTGLLGVTSFLALILVLVIALCLNQRTRYERQLKAATVSAFGSSPLHLDPDFHTQTNLPNTNLHSQDPNPIWMNGYADQHDWIGGGASGGVGGGGKSGGNGGGRLNSSSGAGRLSTIGIGIEDGDYLTSSENSDLNSLSGVNSVSQLHYNATTTATPRDSLNSSQGRVSGSGSGSTSTTTNDRQALCGRSGGGNGHQTPVGQQQAEIHQQQQYQSQQRGLVAAKQHEVVLGSVLKNGKPQQEQQQQQPVHHHQPQLKKRSHQLNSDANNTITHSTFGAFKEVTIYTDHQQQQALHNPAQYAHQKPTASNLVRTVINSNSQHNQQQQQQTTSQVNKIASQLNAKHRSQVSAANQVYISSQPAGNVTTASKAMQQRIIVHANGADVNQGIIKTTTTLAGSQQLNNKASKTTSSVGLNKPANNVGSHLVKPFGGALGDTTTNKTLVQHHHQQPDHNGTAENFETNLSKLSILNLETTEL